MLAELVNAAETITVLSGESTGNVSGRRYLLFVSMELTPDRQRWFAGDTTLDMMNSI
jgi:hypothetical protein